MAKLINPPDTPEPEVQASAQPLPHGFSGKTVTVEFLKTNDQEPRDIFVGVNDYQARIQRGKVVTIPVEVFDVIKGATYTADEADEDDAEKKVWVEKQRYPYNVLERSA